MERNGLHHDDVDGGKSRLERTREKILAESARVFNRRGYHGTTLDEIARAIGLTKPALYYYVKNKEDLLFQCHQRALDIAIGAVKAALAEADRPDDQLRLVLTRYIEGMTDVLSGIVVLLYEEVLSPPLHTRILEQRDEYEGMMRKIIERGSASGVFVPCNPKLVTFAILGALTWIPRWYHPEGPNTSKEIAATFADYFVRGLQRRPDSDTIGGVSPMIPARVEAAREPERAMARPPVRGRYFEDFVVGEEFVSMARTVGEGMIDAFAGVTGDWSEVHTDAELMAGTEFGERIGHGIFAVGIMQGLMWQTAYTQGTAVATLGWDKLKWTAPLRAGDTVRATWTIREMRPSASRPNTGIVTEDCRLVNQRKETVLTGEHVLLVRRRPDGA